MGKFRILAIRTAAALFATLVIPFVQIPFGDNALTSGAEARSSRRGRSASSRSSKGRRSAGTNRSRRGASVSRGRHRGRGAHHGRYRHSRSARRSAPKPRYAYPLDFFTWKTSDYDHSPLDADLAARVRESFSNGTADIYPPHYLVRSGVALHYPLRGGIFKRRDRVKYIVVHSTETGVPQDAKGVINAWSGGGRRHPGTQYIIDRDGTIFQPVHPDWGTVHVNIFKTLPGINNDNTIGIEMCHWGQIAYPHEQRLAVKRLVAYLQDRYHVLDENVITHRYAQQGDHTDPVAFDWEGFLAVKDAFRRQALALKRPSDVDLPEYDFPTASVYMEIHGPVKGIPMDPIDQSGGAAPTSIGPDTAPSATSAAAPVFSQNSAQGLSEAANGTLQANPASGAAP
jgi:hypothetical protein